MNTDKLIYGGSNKLLEKYLKTYGADILARQISTSIPNGWTGIIIKMFWQIKRYHPEAKITYMSVAPISRYGTGAFDVYLAASAEENRIKPRDLPRSLKWIKKQAKREAFSTCAACGQKLGRLKSQSLCSLCACRSGARRLPE